MKRILFLLPLLTILLSGCISFSPAKHSSSDHAKSDAVPIREYSIQSVLWQQLAGEYRALAYQAFNTARFQLDEELEQDRLREKPLAIVADIDETVLDNSPFNAKMIELDEDYTRERWIEWGKEIEALPVPGALDFLSYAAGKGVEVFYISNRYSSQKKETIENLEVLGFPFADESHLLLKESTSKKGARREQVEETHEVILYIGDNLSDFLDIFDDQSTEARNAHVDENKNDFGVKFIVLPNPMYGDWETKGLYEGKYDLNSIQKDSLRKARLRSY